MEDINSKIGYKNDRNYLYNENHISQTKLTTMHPSNLKFYMIWFRGMKVLFQWYFRFLRTWELYQFIKNVGRSNTSYWSSLGYFPFVLPYMSKEKYGTMFGYDYINTVFIYRTHQDTTTSQSFIFIYRRMIIWGYRSSNVGIMYIMSTVPSNGVEWQLFARGISTNKWCAYREGVRTNKSNIKNS